MEEFTLERLADIICGDDKQFAPVYRSSWYLTRFFESIGFSGFKHDGTTRKWWVVECLKQCNNDDIQRVILGLASPKTYNGNIDKLRLAIKSLNEVIAIEGYLVEINGIKPLLIKIEPRLAYSDESLENKIFKFDKPDFNSLGINHPFSSLLTNRWEEIEKCIQSRAFLASTILMGSFLEGTLYWALSEFPEKSNRSSASPKDPKTSKPKPINAIAHNSLRRVVGMN